MWTKIIVMEMGVNGQIQDIVEEAPIVSTDGWNIGCERKKSQGKYNL